MTKKKKAVPKQRGGSRPGSGRPLVEFDFEKLKRAAEFASSVSEIAYLLKVSPATLYRHMESNAEVQAAIDAGKFGGTAKIRGKLFQMAMSGNVTALIFLGKAMCGMKDRVDISFEPSDLLKMMNQNVIAGATAAQLKFLSEVFGGLLPSAD